jgi:hypothetical protein
MERPRFNLKWVFWLVTCCALAAWLLTLPAFFTEPVFSLTSSPAGLEARMSYVPTHWSWEIVGRIVLCAMFFISPAILRWRRTLKRQTPAPYK